MSDLNGLAEAKPALTNANLMQTKVQISQLLPVM